MDKINTNPLFVEYGTKEPFKFGNCDIAINGDVMKYVNEAQNMFIQKYKKDSWNKSTSEKDMQMLNTAERKSETSRTSTKNKGSLFLSSTGETDYGVKWMTNYNNTTVLGTRAVKINDTKLALFWAEKDLETKSNGKNEGNKRNIK